MRFRDTSMTFRMLETADEESVDHFRSMKYPGMSKVALRLCVHAIGSAFDSLCVRVCVDNRLVHAGRGARDFTDSEIIVMLGQNGTGKTTFIKMLAGIMKPDGGAEIPQLNVSYKPQKIAPSFDGSVRSLLFKKISAAFVLPQFQTDVVKPLQLDSIIDQDVRSTVFVVLSCLTRFRLCVGQEPVWW